MNIDADEKILELGNFGFLRPVLTRFVRQRIDMEKFHKPSIFHVRLQKTLHGRKSAPLGASAPQAPVARWIPKTHAVWASIVPSRC